MDSYSNSDVYFAALSKDEIGAVLKKKVEEWISHIQTSGIFWRMKKSYNYYYGLGSNHTSSAITKSGVQGELSLLKVNHFRNLIQHMLIMTTSNRPSMDSRSINTDYRSVAQTVLSNGILDYYMREKRLERTINLATELAMVLGEGYVRLEWDANEGDEYVVDPDTGTMTYTGDLKYSVLNPLDVIKDVYMDIASDEQDWVIVRHFKNKFDLMAKYPDLSDKIKNLETKSENNLEFNLIVFNKTAGKSNLVPVYEFYHRRTDSVPLGRFVVFLDSDIILYDEALPYKGIPVFRIAPGEYIGTAYGYTVSFDLLGLQEMLDALHSTIITNQSTFGVQNILIPKGHAISVDQLAGGLNLIEYDSAIGKPEALNLTYTAPEIFKYLESIEHTMETLSGVNSVARGNPEASLRSGNALALVQSMAIQFNNGLQKAYAHLIEEVGTATIQTLQNFAEAPRVAMIVGKSNRAYMREFKGSDLDKIGRVVVDLGNPLAKTLAGKTEMATNMLNMGLIKTPEQYIQVMKTGNLDTMLEGEMSELMNIKSENEKLAEGSSVIALATDAHTKHITEHKAVVSSPEARENPDIINAVLTHIDQHIKLLETTKPQLLQILGQPPLGQQQGGPPGMPPPGQGMPAEGTMNAAQEQMGNVVESPEGKSPVEMAAPEEVQPTLNPENLVGNQTPGMPNFPKNPLTGGRWTPEGGGLPPQG